MIPPRTVLVGIDFSESSRTALAFAARLAAQTGSKLHVLHAEDPLLAAAAQRQGHDLGEETLDELRRFTAETPPAATCNPRLHAIVGKAHDVVLDIATRERADVIVVGSRGMSGAERLFFGSTAEYIVRRADTSVLVVPPQWTAPRPDAPDLSGFGPLITGIDFSASSLEAAGAAASLAAALHASLEVVHIVPGPHVLQRWQPQAEAAMREGSETARHELESVVRRLAATVPVEPRLETGDVPEGLAARAAAHAGSHPMLVLGRAAGGSRGAAPGAIAWRVLTQARVPVLVYLSSPS